VVNAATGDVILIGAPTLSLGQGALGQRASAADTRGRAVRLLIADKAPMHSPFRMALPAVPVTAARRQGLCTFTTVLAAAIVVIWWSSPWTCFVSLHPGPGRAPIRKSVCEWDLGHATMVVRKQGHDF
jgi:hypothetical protein